MLISQTSLRWETVGGVAKSRLFPQANKKRQVSLLKQETIGIILIWDLTQRTTLPPSIPLCPEKYSMTVTERD